MHTYTHSRTQSRRTANYTYIDRYQRSYSRMSTTCITSYLNFRNAHCALHNMRILHHHLKYACITSYLNLRIYYIIRYAHRLNWS